MEAATAVLKHTADESTVCEKMKATISYCHSLVNNAAMDWRHSTVAASLPKPGEGGLT